MPSNPKSGTLLQQESESPSCWDLLEERYGALQPGEIREAIRWHGVEGEYRASVRRDCKVKDERPELSVVVELCHVDALGQPSWRRVGHSYDGNDTCDSLIACIITRQIDRLYRTADELIHGEVPRG